MIFAHQDSNNVFKEYQDKYLVGVKFFYKFYHDKNNNDIKFYRS